MMRFNCNLPEPMPSHATRTDSHSMDQYGSVWVLGEKKKAVSVLVLVRGKPEEKFGSFRNGVHDSIIHQMKSMDGVGIYALYLVHGCYVPDPVYVFLRFF
ncbi:hypothetical protein T310_6962 [Rasamsonia emersonii CBS 393.64]|uniref:Uncharacterized protein n=1 Tax=Rasamsonia emersonii (strain ATCC 16479 / CBS 393.64 / IMI 116815) TaxID=1408163 RepID=A0A0F4YLG6_RASE3|nr:hypothetical protein T310_6962 [Rasamsonia emersonii CBS 393.64]KKA19084.1 hypothetical protein T310_6962 [Rasamsonia emersonii CBS 393.64]